MNDPMLTPFGLKWNPFSPAVPTEALLATPAIEHFVRRIEKSQVKEGGFALVTGDPGLGKSVVLRLLAERLERLPEVECAALARPQGNLADFYRELGDLFGVPLRPHNRWAGAKTLRERWQQHFETTLIRPVLLVDEAQEMAPTVLNEMRLLSSASFDSRSLLTVVLAGDARLSEKLRQQELLPLGSRIRVRLALEPATPEELLACLRHLAAQAGNTKLMTPALLQALSEHALGNRRVLVNTAAELLALGAERGLSQLDEKLYLELVGEPRPAPRRASAERRRA
ncbi:MAG: ExeA family protein [Burkholderiales bacterium]